MNWMNKKKKKRKKISVTSRQKKTLFLLLFLFTKVYILEKHYKQGYHVLDFLSYQPILQKVDLVRAWTTKSLGNSFKSEGHLKYKSLANTEIHLRIWSWGIHLRGKKIILKHLSLFVCFKRNKWEGTYNAIS